MPNRLHFSSTLWPQDLSIPHGGPQSGWDEHPEDPPKEVLWNQGRLLKIYTGQVSFEFISGPATTGEDFYSFVLCSDGMLQTFRGDVVPQCRIAPTVALASFLDPGTDNDSISAVDEFKAHLVPVHPEDPGQHVLVLKFRAAALRSRVLRVSYQVNLIMAPTKESEAQDAVYWHCISNSRINPERVNGGFPPEFDF